MPNISPGAGGSPYSATPLPQATPAQNTQAKPAAPPPAQGAEKPVLDQAQFQQRSTGTERGQRLTSESTRLQIHQLIQTAVIQQPEQRPQLQLLNRPAMSSALADTLAAHQPAETANAHAQLAGGSLAAASHQKLRPSNEDSAARNSQQSGKRARQEEQEGEFSSLADAEGGMSQGDSNPDQRSDSQKKKQLILQKQSLVDQRKVSPQATTDSFEAASKNTSPLSSRSLQKPGLKKEGASPPTARSSQSKHRPPKPISPKDEWTF